MDDESARKKLTELIQGARTGNLATIDDNGRLVSRPMGLQEVEFDGDLWFFTYNDSDKVAEINRDARVNVSFESGQSWVSLSGKAETLAASDNRAKAEELWSQFAKAYFPDGLDDPKLCLIKVHAESAEYWDAPNKLVQLFDMAKAVSTGQRADPGENKTVEL